MLSAVLLLVAFSFVAEGHMHIDGVPIVTGDHHHRRLFVPIDPNFCNAQEQQAPVSCLQSTAGGIVYCSSYLSIPTITVCTTATVPAAAGTTTVTSTLGQTAVRPSSNVRRANIVQETPSVQYDATSPAWKRILVPRQANGCFPATQSAPYSSSVCSCLNIPTPTTTTTFSYTIPPSQTQTVVITPSQSFTTITSFYTGTVPATSTFSPAGAGQPATVVVYSPYSYVTTTSLYTGSVTTTVTQFTPTTAGQTGTVVVQVPPIYTTVSRVGPATTFTQFTATTPGQTGTVIVQAQTVYTTITNVGPATTFTQFTATNPGQTGTVIVQSPTTYNTVTNVGPATTFTQFTATAPGQTGTVVVQSPTTYTTVTNIGPATTFTQFTATAPGQTGTVVVQSPTTYTTVTNVGPATTFTQFTATAPGQTGTVVVQSPTTYTTVTNVGPATTFTQFTATAPGQTGTVVVQSPTTYTTVTRVGSATTFTQFTATAPGQTGTVVVQAPASYNTVTTVATTGTGVTTFTQFTATTPGQTGTVVVQYAPLSTVTTTTFGTNTVGYTSTVTTVVSSTTSLVAVVGVPVNPFKIFVADVGTANPRGYLDVVGTGSGPFNATLGNFADGALFYFDTSNNQLALAPASGVSAAPLFSVEGLLPGVEPLQFGLNNPTTNSPILTSLWPEGTIRVATSSNAAVAAFICNGVLSQGDGTVPAGCIQVTLSPTRSDATYVTTTTTTGSTSNARTSAATGTTVSNNGTVTSTQPTPTPTATCTAAGFEWAVYTNPFSYTSGESNINPFYIGFDSGRFATNPGPALYSGTFAGNANYQLSTNIGTIFNTQVNMTQATLVIRGYFLVPTTGNYQLNLPSSDDISYLWIGTAAAGSGWNETNYNIRTTFAVAPRGVVSQTFTAGRLYPIVVLQANGAGGSGLAVTVTTPAGTVLTDTTGYFFQPSCSSLAYLSATPQPSVTGCVATGIEWFNRPNPTVYVTTTTYTTQPLLPLGAAVRTVTTTSTVTRTSSFDPNVYNPPTASPWSGLNYEGVVRDLTLPPANPPGLVYGRGPFDFSYGVTFLRGYFLPNVTGVHTFILAQPDDQGYLWIGDEAVNTWSRTNADIIAADFYGPTLQTLQTLTAGTPVPFRMAVANFGGAYGYTLQVRDPNGVTKSNTWGMFLQPWCGAVAYAQWT